MQRIVNGSLILLAALAAGCFSPKLKNYGFSCDPQAAKPCPDGFRCLNGFCDDGSGGSPPAGTGGNGSGDMSMSGGSGGGGGGGAAGGGGGGGGGDVDMAASTPDMAQSIPDMAKAPPDLVVVSTCAHSECNTGAALDPTCSACAMAVCNADSYCCDTKWDSKCTGTDVPKYCPTKSCP